jgi:hypothetical protein
METHNKKDAERKESARRELLEDNSELAFIEMSEKHISFQLSFKLLLVPFTLPAH